MLEKSKPTNLQELVDRCDGNRSQAARLLGVTASSVSKWLNDDEAPRMAEIAASHLCEQDHTQDVRCVFLVEVPKVHKDLIQEWVELHEGSIHNILN